MAGASATGRGSAMPDRQIDLVSEMLAFAAGSGKYLAKLQALGIPGSTIATLGASTPIGVGRIATLPDLQFEPSEEGKSHIILPVWEGQGVIDLVAFNPADPNRWYRRTGLAPLLNADEISQPRWDSGVIDVWATPLDWLRAGGSGVVILDYDDREIVRQLAQCETIITDNMTARLIRLEFSRPRPVPRIINREHHRHVA